MNDDLSMQKTRAGAGPDGTVAARMLSAGERVGGRYVVKSFLGAGGMGEVYEVEHSGLKKRYALKVIPERLTRNAGFVERFRREAQVTARLEHPNIVRVDDFGEETGHFWLRMDLVEGVEAGEYVEGASGRAVSLFDLMGKAGEQLPAPLAAQVLGQALAGLAYAHSKGAVHRDLKPGNILLSDGAGGPVAKVSDFGLVKVAGEEWLRSMADLSMQRSMSLAATELGDAGSSARSLVGTYEYMAPEQRRGEDVDARSDVYAMGLVIYRMLTGRRELGFDLPSRIVPDLDPAWDDFVKSALEANMRDRFADAGEMLVALGKFCPEDKHWAERAPPAAASRPSPAARGRPRVAGAAEAVEKRLIVEKLRAETQKDSTKGEASLLEHIDRDIRMGREVEDRDPRAAAARFQAAEEALGVLRERRRILAPLGRLRLWVLARPDRANMEEAVGRGDTHLLKGDCDAALGAYREAVKCWDETVERRGKERAEAFRSAVKAAVGTARALARAEKSVDEWTTRHRLGLRYLFWHMLVGWSLALVLREAYDLVLHFDSMYRSDETRQFVSDLLQEARYMILALAVAGMATGILVGGLLALVKLMKAGDGSWPRHLLRMIVGGWMASWITAVTGLTRVVSVGDARIVVCCLMIGLGVVLGASYSRPGWARRFGRAILICIGLLALTTAAGSFLGVLLGALACGVIPGRAGAVLAGLIGLAIGGLCGALTGGRANAVRIVALALIAAVAGLAMKAAFPAAASWILPAILYGMIAGAILGATVPGEGRGRPFGGSILGAGLALLVSFPVPELLKHTRAYGSSDRFLVVNTLVSAGAGLCIGVVMLLASRRCAGAAVADAAGERDAAANEETSETSDSAKTVAVVGNRDREQDD